MFFNRRSKKKKDEPEEKKPTVNQGIFYLYAIIGLQVLFVFGLMAIIITLGKVLATPLWVFLFSLAVGIAGIATCIERPRRSCARSGTPSSTWTFPTETTRSASWAGC